MVRSVDFLGDGQRATRVLQGPGQIALVLQVDANIVGDGRHFRTVEAVDLLRDGKGAFQNQPSFSQLPTVSQVKPCLVQQVLRGLACYGKPLTVSSRGEDVRQQTGRWAPGINQLALEGERVVHQPHRGLGPLGFFTSPSQPIPRRRLHQAMNRDAALAHIDQRVSPQSRPRLAKLQSIRECRGDQLRINVIGRQKRGQIK
jgi:hypothetical protein